MIEPGQRAGVDGKAQRLFRRHRKGVRKGGADRAAVAAADAVAPRMLPGESPDGGGDAPAEGGDALAAARNPRRSGQPDVAPSLAVFGSQPPVDGTLPSAEVLLGQPTHPLAVLKT